MPNRRNFLKNVAGATAGVFLSGRGLVEAGFPSRQIGAPPGKRRELLIGGRRVKTVDARAHCFVPGGLGRGLIWPATVLPPTVRPDVRDLPRYRRVGRPTFE